MSSLLLILIYYSNLVKRCYSQNVKKRQIYLDYAATAPLRKEVLRQMLPYLTEKFGNPNALYGLGREAKQAINQARLEIAGALRCKPGELIFTGSATEADYLALAGIAHTHAPEKGKIIISSVEHKGISSVVQQLKQEGFEVVVISVAKNGLLDLEELKKNLDAKTILVSVTMADSETGTIQPIREIARMIRNLKKVIGHKSSVISCPYFHTDATQAASYLDLNVKKLGVDLLTLSAHKLGGPKGIAALYVKKGIKLEKFHSGTENVPAIVGFGEAVKLNRQEKKAKVNIEKVKKLRNMLEREIIKIIPKVILNGHPNRRLPNFLNISFLDIEGEAILLYLDQSGVMASTGSACDAENLKPSAVLTAMGNPYEFVHGSIRFTLGYNTTETDIKYVLKKLPVVVKKLRQISPLCLTW